MTDPAQPQAPKITVQRARQAAANLVAIANERLADLADRPASQGIVQQALQAEADVLAAFINQHAKGTK